MKLSQRHQETFDEAYPEGYDASKIVLTDGSVVDESDIFHIMYIDIVKDGERTRDVPCVQKYSVQDWKKTKPIFEVHAIKAVTGHSEYCIIHDPIEAKAEKARAEREAKAKVKPEVKPKGRPPQK